MEDNVVNIFDKKSLETIVQNRVGNKFVIAVINEDGCQTYISEELTDMELCYIVDTLDERRRK